MKIFNKIVAVSTMAAVCSGCALHNTHIPPKPILTGYEAPETTLGISTEKAKLDSSLTAKFYEAYHLSFNAPRDATAAREFTRYGIALVDLRCDLFFQQIGRGAQNGDFIKRQYQSLSAALIAALGVASVASDTISGVGIGSALGLQTIDNYSNVFFFSPEVSSVHQLVRRALNTLKDGILSPNQSPKDFIEAGDALRTYQNLCSAHEIKRLVTESIDSGKTVPRFGEGEAPIEVRAVYNLRKIRDTLKVANVSLREAVLLELLLKPKANALDATTVDYVCSTFPTDLQGKICDKASVSEKNVRVERFTVRNDSVDDAELRTLEAQWAALYGNLGNAYTKEIDAQQSIITSTAPIYNEKVRVVAEKEEESRAKTNALSAAAASQGERDKAVAEAKKAQDELAQAKLSVQAAQDASLNASGASNQATVVNVGVGPTASGATPPPAP